VNSSQSQAEALARGFQTGESDVSLEETMVSIAKANVSFQTLVQVRSRLVAAYHDIMNMQV
jgi:flagellar hook-basal body complex protein FliE